MKLPVSAAFERQRRTYRLRFTCEDCAHFERRSEACTFTFPVREHRDATYRGNYTHVVFCKAFELR